MRLLYHPLILICPLSPTEATEPNSESIDLWDSFHDSELLLDIFLKHLFIALPLGPVKLLFIALFLILFLRWLAFFVAEQVVQQRCCQLMASHGCHTDSSYQAKHVSQATNVAQPVQDPVS